MARKHRICYTCNNPIPQSGEHWHMVEKAVEPSRWELFKAFLHGKQLPVVTKRVPQHHNCKHPDRPSPTTFVGVEKQLNHDTYMDGEGDNQRLHSTVEKEFENV